MADARVDFRALGSRIVQDHTTIFAPFRSKKRNRTPPGVRLDRLKLSVAYSGSGSCRRALG